MKKVEREDLVIGSEYFDIDSKKKGLKMVFVGDHYLGNNKCLFFYPIGNDLGFGYEPEDDGTIPFCLTGGNFYEQD